MARSAAEIQADLDVWYAARTKAAEGKSFTFQTSSGSRTVTLRDMAEINGTIKGLESELQRVNSGYGFSLANFNNDLPR